MRTLSYRGYRFPPAIIQRAVGLHPRFTPRFGDVEDLPAERAITVSREMGRKLAGSDPRARTQDAGISIGRARATFSLRLLSQVQNLALLPPEHRRHPSDTAQPGLQRVERRGGRCGLTAWSDPSAPSRGNKRSPHGLFKVVRQAELPIVDEPFTNECWRKAGAGWRFVKSFLAKSAFRRDFKGNTKYRSRRLIADHRLGSKTRMPGLRPA